jgi:hypothetical protein
MDDTSNLNVIVVNYRTSDLTIRCVNSIVDTGVAQPNQIVVVDNYSQDGSLDRIQKGVPPEVVFITASHNGGFGAGVNLGFRNATGRHLLILNPDTYFEFDSVSPVLRHMEENEDVGIVGLDLINPDGSRQYSARRFYSLMDVFARRVKQAGQIMQRRIDRHLMRDAWIGERPFDADWVMGTGFVIRRDLYERLDGMDESYFLYMEDVDLCARVWRAGKRVICYPGAQLVHDHQRSSSAGPLTFAGRTHIRSLLLFRKRYTLPLMKSPGIQKIVNCRS